MGPNLSVRILCAAEPGPVGVPLFREEYLGQSLHFSGCCRCVEVSILSPSLLRGSFGDPQPQNDGRVMLSCAVLFLVPRGALSFIGANTKVSLSQAPRAVNNREFLCWAAHTSHRVVL